MVVIRLARGGAKKKPFYRIVVADQRMKRDGRFIEQIGFYSPLAKGSEESFRLNEDRYNYWCNKGAQPSQRVNNEYKTFKKVSPAS